MTAREISPLVSRLGALPFFPGAVDVDARIAIAEVLLRCCGNNLDRVEWTVNRCLEIWDKWEGPHELRAVVCSRWCPADGGEDAVSRLPQFADGIPSQSEARNQELLGGGEQKRLAPGAAAQLMKDVRTTNPAPRPRDKVDEISEYTEREKAFKRAPVPTEAEIQALKELQDRNRKESRP